MSKKDCKQPRRVIVELPVIEAHRQEISGLLEYLLDKGFNVVLSVIGQGTTKARYRLAAIK